MAVDMQNNTIMSSVDLKLLHCTVRRNNLHEHMCNGESIVYWITMVIACEEQAGRRVGDHHEGQCRGL